MSDMRKQLLPTACAFALLGAVAVLVTPHWAQAAECSTLSHPVVVAGSTAVKPFIAKVAAELRQLPTPITIVYSKQGSCVGVQALAGSTPGRVTGTGVLFDNDGKDIAGGCDMSLPDGNVVDVGVSDVYPSSCGATLPSDVKDFHGPIQAMTFVVPKNSTQTSISAEAAYLLMGFGANGAVSPWTDQTQVQVRSASSGTQQMIAAAINVPATKWQGNASADGTVILNALAAAQTAGNAEKAIGILATDVADKSRSAVTALAYQHYDQTCGYWPDSAANTFDKQNVRDGHYMIWGPLHLFSKITNGAPSNPDAKVLIDYLTGTVDPAKFLMMIELEAKSGVVPECAMRVSRTEEVGPLASFMPEKSCECAFLKFATGTAPASCRTCTTASDCSSAAPACNYGFCEVK
jgi:ABC-type phosphate transport system substrate-binding protein